MITCRSRVQLNAAIGENDVALCPMRQTAKLEISNLQREKGREAQRGNRANSSHKTRNDWVLRDDEFSFNINDIQMKKREGDKSQSNTITVTFSTAAKSCKN